MNKFINFMQKSFGGTNQPIVEKKSLDIYNTPGVLSSPKSFVSYLFQNGNSDLAFYMLMSYYEMCAPFADAIDSIAQEVSVIPIRLYDKENDEFITDHPVLDFLKYPNADSTQQEFIFRFAAVYLITGNVFPYITGDIDRPPLELNLYGPNQSTLVPANDGFIGTVNINSATNSTIFRRQEDNDRFRYYNDSETAEIMPVRRFNPRRDANHLYGISKANSLIYEIEQYIHSSQHNLSLLKNGARPGGSFSTTNEHPLTDEQFQRLNDQITQFYQGSANSGRPLLLENTQWTEHIVNNRDMDYATMRKGIMEMIYARFDIPLSLVSSDSMTYDNYETGRITFFDSAVLPLTKNLYEQLAILLMPRYEDDYENYEFVYNESDIPALELRRNQKIKLRKEIGVNTINELRKYLGDEELEGGNVLLKPSSEIPIAMDLYTEDQRTLTNAQNEEDDEKDLAPNFVEFKSVLEKQLDAKGKRVYSDEEIVEKAKYYGIQQFESC